ncbi:hypothetical protein TBR22_A11200 [Luteitalea sp. TBR-22]|uniref:hypothetical protein n=1 Tax=Luteitalea sp. TBR-22 TaxID=2802971 RepID=UPI001AF974CC|nr:hypothetical protein [Luteitalea sp. TBR-22]BCS31917.1 hypothetical protein TBR22_A11200 [Luteitalea sp. TBR-22]
MSIRHAALRLVVTLLLLGQGALTFAGPRWTEQQARDWYARQGFLVGANFVPATAINELEMWQAETFDPARIDLELGWAAGIGMNTMRVFLHDLAYQQDPEGFLRRVDQFLAIAAKHRIRPMLVLLDSVWDPFPAVGPQRPPRPGVHNSGWVQSPGKVAIEDPTHWPRLEQYVKGVVGRFKDDGRVLAWDLWNEVDNMNDPAYLSLEPKNKGELVLGLLPQVYAWAREAGASQPLTSGLWRGGDWSKLSELAPIDRVQLALSDVITFHSYDPPAQLESRIMQLKGYNRPIICTEYMARGNGSTFEGSLPILKRHGVGAINWGLVQGKAQTHLPWDSWRRPYVDREPTVWFHEVFRRDGTPYDPKDIAAIKAATGR